LELLFLNEQLVTTSETAVVAENHSAIAFFSCSLRSTHNWILGKEEVSGLATSIFVFVANIRKDIVVLMAKYPYTETPRIDRISIITPPRVALPRNIHVESRCKHMTFI
jgi:hypothetical protein